MQSHAKHSVKYTLKWCVLVNVCLLAFLVSMCALFTDTKKNVYMRYGPNESLNILGITIDTWPKYVLLQLCIFAFQIADTIIQEFASPVLGFNIYNPDKKEITDFTRFELQFFAQSFWLINNIKSAIMLIISITQMDLAMSKVVYSEIAGIYTIATLIAQKTFVNHNNSECDVEKPLIESPV